EKRDHDGDADERARNPPKKAPEEYRQQDQERRHRQGGAGDPRLEIAADQELNEIEAYEDDKGELPRPELHEREQRRKDGREERADEWYVVEHECDDAP